MAILSQMLATASVLAAGCYEPQLGDCVVSCTGAADCAPGQVCGSDGMCAVPELAGRCTGTLAGDAGSIDAALDARMVDAAPIDASSQIVLQIEIRDQGALAVQNAGSCHFSAPMHMCAITVTGGAPRLLTALPDAGYRFDKWEVGPCIGDDETCLITPIAPVTQIKVKFRRISGSGGDDDE